MKIERLKKVSKGKYKLFFDNKEELTLYEDVIVNNNLLLNKNIDDKLLSELNKENYHASLYNFALSYISVRLRSRKEIEEYLTKKCFEEDLINETIKKLTDEGYIDDYKFAISYLNDKLNLGNHGPYRIKRDLEGYDVSESIINSVISEIDNELIEDKIKKLIDKQLKINKKYTGNVLRMKILNYLANLGYDKESVVSYLDNINTKNNGNIVDEYNKLYKTYSSKYSGNKLKMVIRQKLYQKGYSGNDLEVLSVEK